MSKVNRLLPHVWMILAVCLAGCAANTPTPSPSPTQVPTRVSPTATPTPAAPTIGPSHVYLVESDGSNLRQLARGTLPQFSGDGQYLSFLQWIDEDQGALVLYDRRSEEMRSLDLHGWLSDYAWSPDSEYIAAVTQWEDIYELYLIAPQSGNDMLIASAEYIMPVQWSPNARYIAWVAADSVPMPPYSPRGDEDETTRAALVVYDVEEQQQTTLVSRPSMICSPTWSPDSTQIAFSAGLLRVCSMSLYDAEASSDLYRVDVDGHTLARLTESDGAVFSVEWSPTDNLIAYIEVVEMRAWTLHIIDAGTEEERFSTGKFMAGSLMWAPNGQGLAVSGSQVDMYDMGTFTRQTLIGGPASFWPASWSPDGNGLLVGFNCCGLKGFYYVEVDQANTPHEVYESLEADSVFTAEDPTWAPDADLIAFSGFPGCRGCP
jgi:Tol biopolymer transport system component